MDFLSSEVLRLNISAEGLAIPGENVVNGKIKVCVDSCLTVGCIVLFYIISTVLSKHYGPDSGVG